MSEPALKLYDVHHAAEYVRSLGGVGVTVGAVRQAIADGRLTHVKIGKKFFVSEVAIHAWLSRAERKGRS